MPKNPFRQAALVLANLDCNSRDAVLDRMPTEQSDQVRSALMTLQAEDDSAQHLAAQEFLATEVHVKRSDSRPSPTSQSVLPDATPTDHLESCTPSLRDLLAHTNQSIADAIVHERATTIGALLSSIPGNRAAGILIQFPAQTRLRVVAILDAGMKPNAHVVDLIAEWICDHLAEASVAPAAHSGQRDALRAILDEFQPEERDALLADLAAENPLLAQRLTEETSPSLDACYC